ADGGFLPSVAATTTGQGAKASLRATSSALRALKYFGGAPRDKDAAAKFTQSCHDKASGGFAHQPGGKPAVALAAAGITAGGRLKGPGGDYRRGVVKSLADHAKTFEEIRIAAAGLEAISQRPPQADAWVKQVAGMANPDGTFGKGDGPARDTGGAVVVLLR